MILTEYWNEREKKQLKETDAAPTMLPPHHLFDRETKSPFSSATRTSTWPVFHRTIVHFAKCVQAKIEHRTLMVEYNLAIHMKI